MNGVTKTLSSLTVVGLATVTMATPAFAADYIVDDFDGGASSRVTSSSVSPDNSGNTGFGGAPGVFPSSNLDVFGRTNRAVGFDFADDSATGLGNPGEFDGDDFGIVPYTGPGGHDGSDHFFGTNDVDNNDNPNGGGTATWTMDITNLEDLSFSVDLSAMGNYESGDNTHSFSYSIDGGPSQTLVSIDANDSASFTYQMESNRLGQDTLTNTLDDPLEITDDNGTRVIDNTFTTVGQANISGIGNSLTLTYTAGPNNGGSEPFAFDNVRVSGSVIPEPTSAALLGLGGLAMCRRRRRRA